MPGHPTVDDLRSDPLIHRFGDSFNPPGLTNFLGCVQSSIDLTGIQNLNFPPFGTGPTLTTTFVLGGRHFPSLGVPVTTTWYPDKIIRTAEWSGYTLESKTILIPGLQAVLIIVDVSNHGPSADQIEIGFNLAHRVGRSDLWDEWLPKISPRTNVEASTSGLVVAHSDDRRAACITAVDPLPDETRPSALRWAIQVDHGDRYRLSLCSILTENLARDLSLARDILAVPNRHLAETERFWNDELQSIFTPGNDRYSGHLPVLETDNDDIRRLYWMGAVGLAYFKRESPYSVVGRSYDTLMPRFWSTLQCIWDYYLSSPAHALLDPAVMRSSLERWMQVDLHKHFGTEYLTGSAIGPWYAINDSAMASMIHRLASWSGDFDWLEKDVGGRSVADHALAYAGAWRALRTDSGLAGFGDEYNLLECVGSYVHVVASLNAASIRALRQAAGILACLGKEGDASRLRSEADTLLDSLRRLYAKDEGFWNAQMPDGTLREVRHAFDLLTVLNSIPEDLSPSQKTEMTSFFERELKTDTWMRALSAADDDVLFSIRPDHQWTGAYAAWPSETVKGLCRIGRADIAAEWMKGLARSANQGPFAQAHMADGVISRESGGAAKSTFEFPYINDWHSSSSGSWVSAVIEGLFGVQVGFKGPTARPYAQCFDPNARLIGLEIQRKSYTVDRNGIRRDDR